MGRGLRNADWGLGVQANDKSDPYCICEIKGKPRSKFKTKTIEDSCDPVWNHEASIFEYAEGDTITFSVWDKDTVKWDDKLGNATLSSAQFHSGGFNGELQLADAGDGIEAYLKIEVTVTGR